MNVNDKKYIYTLINQERAVLTTETSLGAQERPVSHGNITQGLNEELKQMNEFAQYNCIITDTF